MKALVARFVREDSGQDLIDYGLLVGIITAAAVGSIQYDRTDRGELLLEPGDKSSPRRRRDSIATTSVVTMYHTPAIARRFLRDDRGQDLLDTVC